MDNTMDMKIYKGKLNRWLHALSILESQEGLGRFGFHNSNDLFLFINSPEGQTIKKLIKLAIAEEGAQKHNLNEMFKKKLKHRNFLLGLILLALHNKEVKAHKLNEYIQLMIDKQLEKERETIQNADVNAHKVIAEEFFDDTIFQTARRTEEILEDAWQDCINDTENFIKEFEHLELMQKDLILKHQIYDEHVKNFDENILQDLSYVNTEIADIEDTIQNNATKIGDLLNKDEHSSARALLHKNNALTLQHSMLKIMQEGLHAKIVVNYDGQFYLIDKHQNIEKLSIEEKQKANMEFDALRNQITNVKNQVEIDKAHDQKLFKENFDNTCNRCSKTVEKVLNLAHELNALRTTLNAHQTTMQPRITLTPLPNPNPASVTLNLQPPAKSNRINKDHLSETYRNLFILWQRRGVSKEEGVVFQNHMTKLTPSLRPQAFELQQTIQPLDINKRMLEPKMRMY